MKTCRQMCNTMIGTAGVFIELLRSQAPGVGRSMTRALADNDMSGTYARLPSVRFSGDILDRQAKRLLVFGNSGSVCEGLRQPHSSFPPSRSSREFV
jgi:hypothetical protein